MRISDWSSDVCSSDLRLRSQHRIEQPAAAQPGDQSAESLDAAALRLLLKTAENRGEQGVRALLRDAGRHAQFLRHRFDAARLLQDVRAVHGFSPSSARTQMRRYGVGFGRPGGKTRGARVRVEGGADV